MPEGTFRSKYAGKPGSLVAIRLDYARRSTAFDDVTHEKPELAKIKRDVKRWKQGQRLGDKLQWNPSAQPDGYVGSAPQRPLLHQLSEYQGVKLDYNFRASTLPTVNKETQFVPKPSKLQIDRSIFLSAKEKAKLVDRCPGTGANLSRQEIQNRGIPGVERETSWNTSVALDDERTNIYKLRGYEDMREINKTKAVIDQSKYVPPQRRHVETVKGARDQKLAKRTQAASSASQRHEPSEKVFKLSNINDWWDDDFDAKVTAAARATMFAKPLDPIEERAAGNESAGEPREDSGDAVA